jgi:hypothetical protein
MQDFQFNPLDPNPVSLWSVGGFKFEMTAITIIAQDTDSLSLPGVGTVFGNDFDLSPGTWYYNALGSDDTSFTWSNAVRVVPIPAAGWQQRIGLAWVFEDRLVARHGRRDPKPAMVSWLRASSAV